MEKEIHRIIVIHGPNLNLLGRREPNIYGYQTLDEINHTMVEYARRVDTEIETFQSNSEGAIVDKLQSVIDGKWDGVIINPAAYTHTSIAIKDALLLLPLPIIEVHLSNIYKREPFRHRSLTAEAVSAQIAGFGAMGYILAIEGLISLIKQMKKARL